MRWLTICAAALLAAGTSGSAEDDAALREKLPPAARDPLKTKYPDATVAKATLNVYNHKLRFVVILKDHDQVRTLHLTPGGQVASQGLKIAAKDLPKAVIESLAKEYPKYYLARADEWTTGAAT